MKCQWIACLILIGCSKVPSDIGEAANNIGERGKVPQSVKIVAAQVLLRCEIPVDGRVIFFHWEGPAAKPPYTIELPRQFLQQERVKSCLAGQIKSLGMAGELDWGEEPPPPPRGE
jgi:hypothetical protein